MTCKSEDVEYRGVCVSKEKFEQMTPRERDKYVAVAEYRRASLGFGFVYIMMGIVIGPIAIYDLYSFFGLLYLSMSVGLIAYGVYWIWRHR